MQIANCNFRHSSSSDHWLDVSIGFLNKSGDNDSLYIIVRDMDLLCSLRTLRLAPVLLALIMYSIFILIIRL